MPITPGTHSVTVTLPNIPLFVPAAARQELQKLIDATFRLALQHAAGTISDAAPVGVTGHLGQSFGASPAGTMGGIEVLGQTGDDYVGRVYSSLPYAIVIDEGRRPGAPISRVGIDAIGLWAQRKLGLSEDQAERAKWAIANVIVKRGLPATNFFTQGVTKAEPTIQSLFGILGQQIVDGLTAQKQGGA